MGQRLLSLKNAMWAGVTTQAASDRGERRFLKLENCYVSSDGSEIRHFPGWRTLLDLSADNNASEGYFRSITDAMRPVLDSTPSDVYRFYYDGSDSRKQTLVAKAKPVHYHCFEQVAGRLLVIGESRFLEYPLMDSSRNELAVASVTVTNPGSGPIWEIDFSAAVDSRGAADAAGAALNGLEVGDVLYCEDLTVSDTTLQTALDAEVNGLLHVVSGFNGGDRRYVQLATSAVSYTTSGTTAVSAGTCRRTRPNRADSYPADPYDDNPYVRVDDPDALTSWSVHEQLDPDDPTKPCYPAWVVNRVQDFGDAATTPGIEGMLNGGAIRGISRREKRELPFRVNPEPAGDRLILAAPQYNCMFQVPVNVPIDAASWPDSDGESGLPWPPNDIYDRPRALGLPKARLVDCSYTPAPTSPGENGTVGFTFSAGALAASPQFGMPAGTYKMAVAFLDEGTGEEGLASEPIEVEIPSNDFAYYINVNYIHPGYIMPECFALRMNIYLAPPGMDTLGFYSSVQLYSDPDTSQVALSGKYGFVPAVSPESSSLELMRTINLKLPETNFNASTVDSFIDFSRLAPQSASMPRGVEACRYVRGVLVSGGARGNEDSAMALWESEVSAFYSTPNDSHNADNEIAIRQWGTGSALLASPTEANFDGEFGIGGRAFPDAYQGIEGMSANLLPGPTSRFIVDRVVNRRSRSISGSDQTWRYERLRLTRRVGDYYRDAGNAATFPEYSSTKKLMYWRMPRGYLQLSDPGAPSRAAKTAILPLDPTRDDDIVAVGQMAGSAIICSRKETWSLAWHRTASSEIAQLLSNDYGCIAANSMVEFDGGLAWLSERGPVALGAGLQFVGQDIQEWFYGTTNLRYLADSEGMMRHSWGCHDSKRGLVMWGLVTNDSTNGGLYFLETSDGERSRYACDEVLIWSYRSNAFSTWRPPAGMEVLWMRPLRLASGEVVIAFLAADGRIYMLDEAYDDTNVDAISTTATANGTDSTTLTINTGYYLDGASTGGATGRASGRLVRAGMLVEFFDDERRLVAQTTVASATYSAVTGEGVITLSSACTWKKAASGWTVRIGGKPHMTIVSTYVGGESLDNLNVQRVQMRYQLQGTGFANCKVRTLKSDLDTTDDPTTVPFTNTDAWYFLGDSSVSATNPTHSRRRSFSEGNVTAPEIAVEVTVSGSAHTRIGDLSLELGV